MPSGCVAPGFPCLWEYADPVLLVSRKACFIFCRSVVCNLHDVGVGHLCYCCFYAQYVLHGATGPGETRNKLLYTDVPKPHLYRCPASESSVLPSVLCLLLPNSDARSAYLNLFLSEQMSLHFLSSSFYIWLSFYVPGIFLLSYLNNSSRFQSHDVDEGRSRDRK